MTDAPLPDVAYKFLLSSGPLIVVRLPLKGRPGRRTYTARWRDIVQAAGAVLREHGMRAKDLHAIDHHVSAEDWDPDPKDWYPSKTSREEHMADLRADAAHADAAFAGAPEWLRAFYLYDWQDGAFVLVRRPTETR